MREAIVFTGWLWHWHCGRRQWREVCTADSERGAWRELFQAPRYGEAALVVLPEDQRPTVELRTRRPPAVRRSAG